ACAVDEMSEPAPVAASALGQISLPDRKRSPRRELGRRLVYAFAIIAGIIALVWLDRDGYRDNTDPTDPISLIDAIYYTTVSLSTAGYGDITPYTDQARLINAFVVTPARIGFLVLLIGTTLEVLANQGREMFRIARWR